MRRLLLLNSAALDLATTLPLIGVYGIGGEWSPLTRVIFAMMGPAGLILFKAAGMSLIMAWKGRIHWQPLWTAATVAGLFEALGNAVLWNIHFAR